MLARTWNAGISGSDLIRRALRQSIMRRSIPRASPWNLGPMKHPSVQICSSFPSLWVWLHSRWLRGSGLLGEVASRNLAGIVTDRQMLRSPTRRYGYIGMGLG